MEKSATRTGAQQRRIQSRIDESDRAQAKDKKSDDERPMQAGARRYPELPFPKQHRPKPGREYKLDPEPLYDAPHYLGSKKLDGKVAIITGGDSGIGRSVAVLYAREGADVSIVYLEEDEDANRTKEAVEKEGRKCLLVSGDVTDSKFCARAVQETLKEFGRLDILVNNAAFQEHVNSFDELTDEHFDKTVKTNLYRYFYMAKAAVPHMPYGGAIVNCGSVTGLLGSQHLVDYSMTKGGIHAFTRSLATHLIPKGIRVNAVAPGAGVDPLQSRRQGCRAHSQVRRRHADEAAGAAGRDCASVCLSRRTKLLQLHHR
jgi:NAD(P)-dependent dehydrogenase (short-subunit alcohol dehydrogenase family)